MLGDVSPKRFAFRSVSQIEKARHDLETAIIELKRAVDDGAAGPPFFLRHTLSEAARSLERTAKALRHIVNAMPPNKTERAHVHAALSTDIVGAAVIFASRMLLARTQAEKRLPSVTARALAVLLEEGGRDVDAKSVAEQIGCTRAVARTTLHRLVTAGHAERTTPGRFRAKTAA